MSSFDRTLSPNRPRIALVITRAEIGGAQTHILALLPALLVRYDVCLFTGHAGPLTENAQALGTSVVTVSETEDLRAFGLAQALRAFRPDLIHVHSFKAAMLGRWVAQFMKVPVVYTVHGWAHTSTASRAFRNMAAHIERRFVPLTHALITLTASDQNHAVRLGYAEACIKRIPNGIEDTEHHAVAYRTKSPVDIVMPARFCRQKDHKTAIKTLNALPKGMARLTFLGDGPTQNAIQAQAKSLGLSPDVVRFLGKRDDVAAQIAKAQIFLHLSHYEGQPYAIIEALRAGLPCLITDLPGADALIESGKEGWRVPPEDPETARKILGRLASDPARRFEMGQNARLKYETAHRLHHMTTPTLALYDQILAEQRPLQPRPRMRTAQL